MGVGKVVIRINPASDGAGLIIYPLALADARAAAESEFHVFMLAVKEQVIAQYGKSSDQVQSLGLKKKTEYKAPARRAKVAK